MSETVITESIVTSKSHNHVDPQVTRRRHFKVTSRDTGSQLSLHAVLDFAAAVDEIVPKHPLTVPVVVHMNGGLPARLSAEWSVDITEEGS